MKDASFKNQMEQNFRFLPLMACMILGDAFKPRYRALKKNFPCVVAPRSPFFRMLQQPETLNCLVLELINGLCKDSDLKAKAFAILKNMNFQLENEVNPFKSIFEGIFHQKLLPVLKLFLQQACSLSRDLSPSKCFLKMAML